MFRDDLAGCSAEDIGIAAVRERHIVGDFTALVQFQQSRIHGLHLSLAAGLHLAVAEVLLAFTNMGLDRVCRDENLACQNAALAVGSRQQLLSDDRSQDRRVWLLTSSSYRKVVSSSGSA